MLMVKACCTAPHGGAPACEITRVPSTLGRGFTKRQINRYVIAAEEVIEPHKLHPRRHSLTVIIYPNPIPAFKATLQPSSRKLSGSYA